MKRLELVGQKFNRLTVTSYSGNRNRRSMWSCVCECGRVAIIQGVMLKNGNTKSCGCLGREKTILRNTTHNKRDTAEYSVWWNMIARCKYSSADRYGRYKNRGISVDRRWLDFSNFLEDMGERPSPRHSIERLDNDKDYTKSNCVWATAKDQANNRSSNRMITYDGTSKTLAQWSDETGIKAQTIAKRLKLQWPVSRALTQGVR